MIAHHKTRTRLYLSVYTGGGWKGKKLRQRYTEANACGKSGLFASGMTAWQQAQRLQGHHLVLSSELDMCCSVDDSKPKDVVEPLAATLLNEHHCEL